MGEGKVSIVKVNKYMSIEILQIDICRTLRK